MQKFPFVTGSIARASAFCLLLTVTSACGPVLRQPDDNPAVGSGHTDLTGQVLLGDLGPASGAVVTLDGPDELIVVADESGQFRFRNVAAGAYQLQAAAGPDTLEQVIMHPLTVPTQGSVSVETLVFTPTGDISGNVNVNGRESDGHVLVYIPGTSWLALSDDDGSFTISRVPVGSYRVVAKGTSTTAATAPAVVVEYQQETIIPDFTVTAIDPTTAGQSCWDLNGNGNPDLPGEDLNGDGLVDVDDCHGQDGQNGTSGQHCWDLNGDGVGDLPDEDQNDDGAVNAADCGANAIQFPTRIEGDYAVANAVDLFLIQAVTEITGTLVFDSAFASAEALPSLQRVGGVDIAATASGVIDIQSPTTWTVTGDIRLVTDANSGEAAAISRLVLPVQTVIGDVQIAAAQTLTAVVMPVMSVGHDVRICGNPVLESLYLPAVTLNGSVKICDNPLLSTWASPAYNIGGNLELSNNPAMVSLELPNLMTLGGDLVLRDLNALAAVTAPVTTAAGGILITGNDALEVLTLNDLADIGRDSAGISFLIESNKQLHAVSLPVKQCPGSVTIAANAELTYVTMPRLPFIGRDDGRNHGLTVRDNPKLSVFETAVSGIAGALMVVNNDSLIDLALNDLQSLGKSDSGLSAQISGNALLESLSMTVQQLPGAIDITNNSALTTVALPVLSDVGKETVSGSGVLVAGNAALSRFQTALSNVAGSMTISGSALTAITLDRLTDIGDGINPAGLFVKANPMLSRFEAALIQVSGSMEFDGNATLDTLLLPSLSTVGTSGSERLAISNNAALTTVSIPVAAIYGSLLLTSNPALIQATFPDLSLIGRDMIVDNNTSLSQLSFPVLSGGLNDFFITNNAGLCQTAVTAIRNQVSVWGLEDTSGNDSGC